MDEPDDSCTCLTADNEDTPVSYTHLDVYKRQVIREVWEETGLKISEPKLCGIKDWMKDEETRYIVLLD